MYPRLPLKFILLWSVNLALILVVYFALGLHTRLTLTPKLRVSLILVLGLILAGLEQALWNKMHGLDDE